MRRYIFAHSLLMIWASVIAGPGQAPLAAERSASVRDISDLGVLILADDRQVCLSGLWIGGLDPEAAQRAAVRAALDELIDDRPVLVDEDNAAPFDRYGCGFAHVETAGGVLLQHALLERGLALVKPSPSATGDEIEGWLALEAEAREAGIGLWADPASLPRTATAMTGQIGRAALVEGRVVRHSDNDRYAYLNFGKDWRTDFTVRLRQNLLKQSGIDAAYFDGKTLRVRGFVQQSRGPLIDISHLKQIEVIP